MILRKIVEEAAYSRIITIAENYLVLEVIFVMPKFLFYV